MLEIQLKNANLTKKQLANKLGVSQNAISKWKDSPPKYAMAYLKLYIEVRNSRQVKAWVKRWIDED